MKFLVLLAILGSCASQSSTYPPKTNPPPPQTTQASNPLSNSDGTPCNCNKATMWLDLIFVVDRSKSIGKGGVGAIGAQIATSLYGVNIAQNGTDYYTRLGLVVFSSDVTVVANLTTYNSYDQATNDLLTLESYHNTNDGVVDIYAGLNAAQNMFQTQINNKNRKARQVVVLFASSYNQVGNNNPLVLANQMNQSNVFIITVDYYDVQGAATKLLSQIATPFMNFSSNDQSTLQTTFDEVTNALCYSNCVCPASMTQLITYNPSTGRQTYWADCYIPYLSGAFAQFAEAACKEVKGSLISLQTGSKSAFVTNSVVSNNGTRLMTKYHTGLHRDSSNNWAWYGYQGNAFALGSYQPWSPGFNSSSAGDCVYNELYDGTNWGWATENCIGQNPYPYVCQVRACDTTYDTCDCTTWYNDNSCS